MEKSQNRDWASHICSNIAVELVRSGGRRIVVNEAVFATARDALTKNPPRFFRPTGFTTISPIPSSFSFGEFLDCLRSPAKQSRTRTILWHTHLGSATFYGLVVLSLRKDGGDCECTAVANPLPGFIHRTIARWLLTLMRQTKLKPISWLGTRLWLAYQAMTNRLAMTLFRLGWA